MNQSALKSYAPQARLDFIQAVKDRAAFFGLTSDARIQIQETGDVVIIGGQAFPKVVAQQRKALLQRIAAEGYEAVMEAMAYTWFNRFVALRFMEVHGYLDHGYRVLSHPAGKPNPEILDHAERVALPGLDPQQVIQLKLDGNRDAELYRLLLVAQCNALHQAIPFVFGKIADETELLLPDNLLHSDSVIRRLVNSIDEADWQEVEVLGWLYQFYISQKKDAVMGRKGTVPTEDIPAVTQLFTPHWIVRYLVENSLGRLWLLNRPGSRLKEHMPYYIQGEPETDFLRITKPEDIQLCDPACGSGHMLTYAFDLLCLIYEEEGYSPHEIPGLILRHNLHGLEICPRAAQLAAMALVFKARAKSRRFLQPENLVQPQIIELRDIRFEENELRDYTQALGLGDLFTQPVLKLLHQFEEAKNFGSLIQPCLDERAIANARRAIEAKDLGGQLFLRETHLKVLRVLEQAEALTPRYHVVVANPPYMGVGAMTGPVKAFAKSWFPRSKTDFFAMFIERAITLCVSDGFAALVTMHGWMFLSTFEDLRRALIASVHLKSLIHIGPRGFDSISGEVVQTAAFVLENRQSSGRSGTFIRLVEGDSEEGKVKLLEEALETRNQRLVFAVTGSQFDIIPGSPIAYWVSEAFRRCFDGSRSLGDRALFRQGMSTTDAGRFEREWHEIDRVKLNLKRVKPIVEEDPPAYWYPFNKGGSKRRWYGNLETVVRYERNGQDLLDLVTRKYPKISDPEFVIKNRKYFFLPAITYASIGTGSFVSRSVPAGCTYSVAGPAIFPDGWDSRCLLALLCSTTTTKFLEAINPTLGFQITDVGKIPISDSLKQLVEVDASNLAEQAISVARADWDNFETSWDFRDQPLLRPGLKGATLEVSWRNWEAQSTAAIRRMQELETENNRLFIAAYGLEGELQPEVPEDQITLARADLRKDMGAFLSYAIGCMMGRYSLQKPGLILANAGDTVERYWELVGARPSAVGSDNDGFAGEATPQASPSSATQSPVTSPATAHYPPPTAHPFAPDADGIVPVTELAWFSDDATERFIEFLGKTFTPDTLEVNLKFLADALTPTKDETPRDTIRRYLAAGFYKDHLQTYKRRPIYWLFSSGKQRAFQCLVYLHRYHEGTLARMRTEYVIPLQGKISHRIDQLAGDITAATSTSHRKKLEKERDSLVKQTTELAAFDEKLRHYADQRIALDLDDGVKVNYAKFGDLLAEVKAVTGGGED
jgi:hypothetical protein